MGILAIVFAFGFTLMVLVYAIGPISGCHINSAVTIAMMVAKKIGVQDRIAYMVTQIIGALLASAVLLGILSGVIGDSSAGIAEYSRAIHGLGANDVPSFLFVGSALGLEVVLTALFLYVIFNATSAIADEDLERSTDTKTSAVHFMRFEMTDEMADALKNDANWMIGVQHPVYTYELRVEAATRESLLNDLH